MDMMAKACLKSRLVTEWRVETCPFLPKDEETGLYVLPDGRAVTKEKVEIRERFATYGPEDLPWLLYSGRVTREKRVLYFLFNFPPMSYEFAPEPDFNFKVKHHFSPIGLF